MTSDNSFDRRIHHFSQLECSYHVVGQSKTSQRIEIISKFIKSLKCEKKVIKNSKIAVIKKADRAGTISGLDPNPSQVISVSSK